MTKCGICGRDSDDDLCRYHLEALNNLRVVYDAWKKASEVSWEEYLERLEQIEETGRWVVDVIEYVRQQGVPLGEM
jgi:hypothetical protein